MFLLDLVPKNVPLRVAVLEALKARSIKEPQCLQCLLSGFIFGLRFRSTDSREVAVVNLYRMIVMRLDTL